MKGIFKSALSVAFILSVVSTSVFASQPTPESTAQIADATFVDISAQPAAPLLQTTSAIKDAFAIVAPAIQADASALAAKGNEVARSAQTTAQGWFRSTVDGFFN